MTPNPFLTEVRRRITDQGAWSKRALFPKTKQRVQPAKKVFLLSRGDRRFVVVAKNFVEADNRLSATLD